VSDDEIRIEYDNEGSPTGRVTTFTLEELRQADRETGHPRVVNIESIDYSEIEGRIYYRRFGGGVLTFLGPDSTVKIGDAQREAVMSRIPRTEDCWVDSNTIQWPTEDLDYLWGMLERVGLVPKAGYILGEHELESLRKQQERERLVEVFNEAMRGMSASQQFLFRLQALMYGSASMVLHDLGGPLTVDTLVGELNPAFVGHTNVAFGDQFEFTEALLNRAQLVYDEVAYVADTVRSRPSYGAKLEYWPVPKPVPIGRSKPPGSPRKAEGWSAGQDFH
jgi:hypothetical protein